MCWPSHAQYNSIIAKNMVTNSKFTVNDIDSAQRICGNPYPILQGKMTYRPMTKIDNNTIDLPPELI